MKTSNPNDISKSFCSFAFNQVHVSPMGNVKPCCIFDGAIKDEQGNAIRISDDKISSIWNGSHFAEIRRRMLEGETVQECRKCIEEEKLYFTSDRTRSYHDSPSLRSLIEEAKKNDGKISAKPTILNLKMGNTCNLKCRMCQPLDSSSIDNEFSLISKTYPLFRNFDNASAFDYYYDKEPIETAANWVSYPQALENIKELLKTTSHLSLAGGETTFTPQAIELIKYCISTGISKNIELTLSTNLTRITDAFVDMLASFRLVVVTASIDGTGEVLEYIRYPSKWKIIEENLKKILFAPANILTVVTPTVQIYNILYLVDIFRLIEDIHPEMLKKNNLKWEKGPSPCYLTILLTPQFLSIHNLPKSVKELALKKLKDFAQTSYFISKFPVYSDQIKLLIETLNQNSIPENNEYTAEQSMAHFMQYTDVLDAQRGQSMKRSLPELYDLLEKENIIPSFPRFEIKSFTYWRYRDLGFTLASQGKHDEALVEFHKAYQLHNDDFELTFSMSISYKELGQKQLFEEFLNATLKINKNHYFALVEMGLLEQERNNTEAALEVFKLAQQNESDEYRGRVAALTEKLQNKK